jgi:hypothetical protein
MNDIEGTPVSEEEVAKGLGFANVFELRRWQTEAGHKLAEAEAKLRGVEGDRDNFRWHGIRQQLLLERIDGMLADLQQGKQPVELNKFRLAIAVVAGKGVDWDNVLKDWGL